MCLIRQSLPERILHLSIVIALVSSLLTFGTTPSRAVAAHTPIETPYDAGTKTGDVACTTGGVNTGFFRISNGEVIDNKNCEGAVVIPEGVTSIGYAFDTGYEGPGFGSGFSQYNSLGGTIPTRVTSLTISSTVTSIGEFAFRGSSITSLIIPNNVTTLDRFAFAGATQLTQLTLGTGLTQISAYAFSGATLLTTLVIPNNVTVIVSRAFEQLTSLTSLTISNSVTTIGDYAFENATALTSLTIPNSVTTIGDYAFFGNTSLTNLTIGNSVTTIGAYAFSNTGLTSITIPNSVTSIRFRAFGNIPAFTLSSSSETVDVNTFASVFTIENLSVPSPVFSITPTPLGMSINPATGALTGIPSTAASATAYTVTATKGLLSASTIFTLTVRSTATAPAAPTLNSVTGGNKQLTIAFTPGDDGGAAITDYEYSLNGGAYISAGTASSPFTISSLSGRTAYSVTIKARNSVGLSTASSSLTATTTDSSLDANEAANASAARVAAAAESARIAKEQKELMEILAIIPKIGELTLSLGETTKSLYSTKCVKGKSTKFVKKGAKCPKGYVRKK